MARSTAIAAVTLVAISAGLAISHPPDPTSAAPAVARGQCVAIDGDTLSCLTVGRTRARVHVRLNGIDAPEMPGHCRAGRNCAPGDPFAAKAQMAAWVKGRSTRWIMLGTDHYGRQIGEAKVGNRDLQCGLLRAHLAIYKPRWDNRRTLRRTCPSLAR